MTEAELKERFGAITGHSPFGWQIRLLVDWFLQGRVPAACDLPTGTGKTSVIALWYVALRAGAPLPRRLIYVVDRRAVVDQATEEAERIRSSANDSELCISTLRGQHVDNREWLADPAAPAIVVGTVDTIGSRLLFSGYGISRKMRPLHAGFLGVDTLFVLDEAHLIPPFEALLAQIEAERDVFGPRSAEHRAILPPLRVLSLSATGRRRDGEIFTLLPEDLQDRFIADVLDAEKLVTLKPLPSKTLPEEVASATWELATASTAARYLIYLDSREAALRVVELIKNRLGPSEDAKARVLPLVGARRLHEREEDYESLKKLGFIAGGGILDKPVFLVATSAGEVGVDLDADHMVCDLVSWERLAQRLGRVNRRGGAGRSARVLVFAPDEPREDPKPHEAAAWAARAVVELLPRRGQEYLASPAVLRELAERAAMDAAVRAKIEAATTKAPLRPALDRPTLEAWSLTSLRSHPGRADVEPWLRGWETDEAPQTRVIWRSYLPVREGGALDKAEAERFFEAAPPHAIEVLETEAWRVATWLVERAIVLKRSLRRQPPEAPAPQAPGWPRFWGGPVAFALDSADELKCSWTLANLAESYGQSLSRHKERIGELLANGTVIVDARFGGLRDGSLDAGSGDVVATADGGGWGPRAGFRIRLKPSGSALDIQPGWLERFRWVTRPVEDEDDPEALVVEMWRDESVSEDDRSEAERPQKLDEHQDAVAKVARAMSEKLRLPEEWARALEFAARHHDDGKAAERWQRAFQAPADGVYAKTRGPIRFSRLNGYRHEFGSLLRLLRRDEHDNLPEPFRELILHLIAAHHGHARPLIRTSGCEDAPPSALEAVAGAIAQRFARLQDQWGPWGLAWWESLLRAADQRASADLCQAAPEAAAGAAQ